MFKKKTPNWRSCLFSACLALATAALTGCRAPTPLPKADLSKPGWKIFQGQAVWRAKRDAPEISGEILLAEKTDGQLLVQFTKTPFPLVLAQAGTNSWHLEFPTENRSFSFAGKTPSRIIWFQLAHAIAGEKISGNWRWRQSDQGWRLENAATDEALEGYFSK